MQDIAIIDIIIFGGASFVLLLLYMLLTGDSEAEKVKQRLRHIHNSGADNGDDNTNTDISLRRQQDSSLNNIGLQSLGEKLSARLQTAGLQVTSKYYLLICAAISAFCMLIIVLLLGKSLLLGALMGFVVGVGLPHLYVGWRLKKQKKQFLQLFPDAIELIVRGLRAGLPITESMQTVAREIPDPVKPVFAEICNQLALGVTLDKAMASMALRLGLTEFNFFVISVVLQRETGGNLGEILSNLADVLRQRHILKLKIKALSSEARASAIIVGSLPFLVFLALTIISPDYLRPMIEDYRGNIAALVALASLATGMFIMARMSQFEI